MRFLELVLFSAGDLVLEVGDIRVSLSGAGSPVTSRSASTN